MFITIEKAIEILTLMGTPNFNGHTEDILSARKLGIEALKYIKDQRADWLAQVFQELPGETKD